MFNYLNPLEAYTIMVKTHEELVMWGWNKDSSARCGNGKPVQFDSVNAKSYCLAGAIAKVCKEFYLYEWAKAYSDVIQYLTKKLNRSVFKFNDDPNTKYSDVISFINQAKEELISL